MPQRFLNDPNRSGGSSALDLNQDTGVVGQYNAARLALWAADVNAMFTEIYGQLNYKIGALVPFSQTVPLTSTGYMPSQSVCGPLAFTPGPNPTNGASCTVRLTADGVHVPTFPGFSTSGAWVNTAGAVNLLMFEYGSGICSAAIGQDGATTGVPVTGPGIASISVPHGINPVLTIATNGTALNPGSLPPGSAFTLTSTHGATVDATILGISVTPGGINVALLGSVQSGDAVELSYTPAAFSSTLASRTKVVEDVNGNILAAITSATVTVL